MARTNLVTNPSFETNIVGYTQKIPALMVASRDTTQFLYGTASMKVAVNGTSGRFASYGLDESASSVIANSYSIPVTPGEQIQFGAYVKRGAGDWFFQTSIVWFNSSGVFISDVTTTSPQVGSSWYRLTQSGTAPAGAASFGVALQTIDANPHTLYTDGWLVEKASTLGAYFDGSSVVPGETYSWTGTPHASTSTNTTLPRRTNIFKTPSLEAIFASANNVTQALSTTTGVVSGTKSLALTATGTDDSYAESNTPGTLYPGVASSKTYTISGYITLTAPQGGTPHANRARKIDVFTKPSGGSYTENLSTQAPNTAGTHRVSVTFTTPANMTEFFVRLYNGATSGNGTVYWDGILLEETGALGSYFDGSTPTSGGKMHGWLGTVNDSQSIEYDEPVPHVTFKHRIVDAWQERSAVPRYRKADGTWAVKRPKRWNGSTWVDLV